jgi:two-component system, OmpR family, phosphate regulon sensor histidine kinase PhoR
MTERLWPAILDRIEEGVILLAADGTIAFANETGQQFSQFIRERLAELARAPADDESREITVTSGEETRWLAIRVSRLDDKTLFILRDVTAQRALEEVGTDVVAKVSHELRTPISILAGYIENLVDFPKMPRPEQAEIFEIMQEHATRLKALLDDLLTLACFDSRSEVLDYGDLDLREFLRRLAKDWQPALASKEMAFILEIADGVESIRVDRFRFEQVMHNLFDNAFKYTPLEGQIRVRAAPVEDRIEISVEDNGAGIPEEDLPHIFEPFYRVDKARSRKYGGTGLGLSIVRHIVALHGGTVRAESTLQMSTRIIISLPHA